MAHIELNNALPGIRALMDFRPETAGPLNDLAEVLLRSENSLSRGERELIGAYVSYLNNCVFCQYVHGAMAAYYLQCDTKFINDVKNDIAGSGLTEKMKSLLSIAGAVQQSGRAVSTAMISNAKNNGASDMEIHDTVLIAAAFCMFNRYVDGLATAIPDDPEYYSLRAERRAAEGYAHYDPSK
jgi:uncharacterized peroxidase-related enzyme